MKKKKRKWLRRLAWLTVLALAAAGAYFIGLPLLKESVTVTYDTYTATTGSISNALSFSGSFALKNSESLYPDGTTTVRSLYVSAGDNVNEGDRIARLANGDILKSGISGRVNVLNVSEGDSVDMNTEIAQIVDFGTLSVSIRVDEYDISDVYVGQACTVTSTSQEKSFDTVIKSINYVSSSSGNVAYYTATADVAVSEEILPGMQASISIPQETVENVVILKMDALSFDNSNQAYVWMKDENEQLYEVPVEVGVDNGNYIEITSGLKDGDTVYVEAEETETESGLAALLSGLGSNRFNAEMGGGMNRGMGGMSGANGYGGSGMNRGGSTGTSSGKSGGGSAPSRP